MVTICPTKLFFFLCPAMAGFLRTNPSTGIRGEYRQPLPKFGRGALASDHPSCPVLRLLNLFQPQLTMDFFFYFLVVSLGAPMLCI